MKIYRRIAAGIMAASLLLATGCGAGSADRVTVKENNAGESLREQMLYLAEYPAFPQYPQESDYADWDAHYEAYEAYEEQLQAITGGRMEDEIIDAVELFSNKTMSAVLSGAGTDNRIYSPMSLYLALSMLSHTAAGECQTQVLDLLGAENGSAQAKRASRLTKWLYADNGLYTRQSAASLWLNEGLTFNDATLKEICEDYRASSAKVPMGTDETNQLIGAWLAEMTGGVLENLSVTTDPGDVMALYSTLYYADQWSDEFDKSKTAEDTFTCADGTEISVDFLNRETLGNYVGDEGFQAATLGLKNGSMTFILPDEGVSMDELLSDPTFWERVEGNEETYHYGEVIWKIPKFSVESTIELKETLQSLGVTGVFDAGTADFSPLTEAPAWVGNLRQGAGVEVDERGVTAAAYTEIIYAGAALPDGRCEMLLDRPFIFLIRSGRCTMFVGIVNTL